MLLVTFFVPRSSAQHVEKHLMELRVHLWPEVAVIIQRWRLEGHRRAQQAPGIQHAQLVLVSRCIQELGIPGGADCDVG